MSKDLRQLEQINTFALNVNGSSISDNGILALCEFIKITKKLNSLALIFSKYKF